MTNVVPLVVPLVVLLGSSDGIDAPTYISENWAITGMCGHSRCSFAATSVTGWCLCHLGTISLG